MQECALAFLPTIQSWPDYRLATRRGVSSDVYLVLPGLIGAETGDVFITAVPSQNQRASLQPGVYGLVCRVLRKGRVVLRSRRQNSVSVSSPLCHAKAAVAAPSASRSGPGVPGRPQLRPNASKGQTRPDKAFPGRLRTWQSRPQQSSANGVHSHTSGAPIAILKG